MTTPFTESVVEEAALEWFGGLGYAVIHGPSIAPGEPSAERASYAEVVLPGRLRDALARLNPTVSPEGLDEAFRKLTRITSPHLVDANHELHTYLVNGVSVEYLRPDGTIGYDPVRVLDFDAPDNNDWLVVNQLTVTEAGHTRRPDIVVFVNGLPLAVLELKNAASENATIWNAFQQLQTYKSELPGLFVFNEVLASPTASRRASAPSPRTASASSPGAPSRRSPRPDHRLPARGADPRRLRAPRFLDLLRYFIVFEDDGDTVVKKLAGYHQFHAVARALDATILASRPQGSRRVGVVWHTQGSGKSLTMAFYAGRVVLHPAMQNPTLVVLTDRNDLDEQLFGTFSRCKALLRQTPSRPAIASACASCSRSRRRRPLHHHPEVPPRDPRRHVPSPVGPLQHRRHRRRGPPQPVRLHRRLRAPHARRAPQRLLHRLHGHAHRLRRQEHAQVFGDDVSVYDIQRAVEDGATVPIYYESRLAKLQLKDEEKPHLDEAFDEVTEGEELEGREKLKTRWSALEALVGTERRLALIAADLVRALRGAARRDGRQGDGGQHEPSHLRRSLQGPRRPAPRLAP
jgi:type I restriction enzyme R subunit